MSSTVRVQAAAMFLGVGALLVGAEDTASAQEAHHFGEKGQLVISAERLVPFFSYSSESVTTTQGGMSLKSTDTGTSLAFFVGREPNLLADPHTVPRVAFDYLPINHLTVGGAFAFAFGLGGSSEQDLGNNTTRKTDAPKSTLVGFAPRAGYILPLGNSIAFWPRAGFGMYWVSSKASGTNNGVDTSTSTTDFNFSLDLEGENDIVPVEHFFITGGPLVDIPLTGSRSVETTTGSTTNTQKNDLSVFHFGLSLSVGGWFEL